MKSNVWIAHQEDIKNSSLLVPHTVTYWLKDASLPKLWEILWSHTPLWNQTLKNSEKLEILIGMDGTFVDQFLIHHIVFGYFECQLLSEMTQMVVMNLSLKIDTCIKNWHPMDLSQSPT